MADTLLEIVIERLGSIVWEEIATFQGVGQLKDRLSRNLTRIRAVLKDAEEKQETSHAVKDWLQELRDVAHVLDDILDECSLASKAKGDNKCISCLSPAKILARRDIGKRMKEVAEKIDATAEDRNKFGFHAGIMEHKSEDDEWRKTTSVVDESKVYGRDRDIEHVVEFLLRRARDNETLVISNCPQLVLPSNMDWLTTLRYVEIWGTDKNARIPEHLKHIPFLQNLRIGDFPSLTSLPDWLGAMTSLQKLEICFCPELSSLPDSFQQLRNLHELRIYGCPKLQKACKEVTGKDWHKIAHVPELKVEAAPPAFWEKMIWMWKTRKQIWHLRRGFIYTVEDEFNSMVDAY